jgi:hypothetical protein
MENNVALKDISTPTLLGYAAELKNTKPNGDKDLAYRISLKDELESRGVKPNWGVLDNLLTGPTE